MDRRSSLLMTLIALLAGGALVPHLTSTPASSQSAGGAAQKTSGAAPGIDPGDADHFIDLVGDMLNVDVSDRGRAFQTLIEAAPKYFIGGVQFLIASLPD